MALSLAAVLTVAWGAVTLGAARPADEGAAAHLWQLLMASQAVAIVVFGTRWLPKAPRSALIVLGMQLALAAAALAPVYFLHL